MCVCVRAQENPDGLVLDHGQNFTNVSTPLTMHTGHSVVHKHPYGAPCYVNECHSRYTSLFYGPSDEHGATSVTAEAGFWKSNFGNNLVKTQMVLCKSPDVGHIKLKHRKNLAEYLALHIELTQK